MHPWEKLVTREQWQQEYDAGQIRDVDYETMSGLPVEPLYGPKDNDPGDSIGWPGQYPYTRGVHPNGYRGRLWTMRMFAGFGTPEDTNARFRDIPSAGGGACQLPLTCRRSWVLIAMMCSR